MRRILFVAFQDYANVSTDIAFAINEHLDGWEARVCSCVAHPFEYPNRHHLDFDSSTEDEKREMAEWIRGGVDVLVWAEEGRSPDDYYSFHSDGKLFARTMLFGMMDEIFSSSRCFVFHAGVAYRTFSRSYNALDRGHFESQLVSPDLWRLTDGLRGIAVFGKPMLPCDDYTSWDTWSPGERIEVCHSPTSFAHKGTRIVDSAMDRVRERLGDVLYRHIGGPAHRGMHVPHQTLKDTRRKCHLYVDQFSSIGGIGVSALESMSDGMVSLCTTHMIPESVWGSAGLRSQDCPIVSLPCPTGDKEIDVQALTQTLLRTCSEPESLPWLGSQGKEWIRMAMDPKRFAQRFISSLKEPIDCA